jgi:hypothetical protein
MANNDVKWTKDQTRVILSSVIDRLKKKSDCFNITHSRVDMTIENRSINNYVTIIIYKNSHSVWMKINDYSGRYEGPSIWPWKDKDIKVVIESLLKFDNNRNGETDIIQKAILRAFPEITDIEFEEQVLK